MTKKVMFPYVGSLLFWESTFDKTCVTSTRNVEFKSYPNITDLLYHLHMNHVKEQRESERRRATKAQFSAQNKCQTQTLQKAFAGSSQIGKGS